MNTYLLLKTVHILSSVLLVGTGFGSAFYLFFANRSDNAERRRSRIPDRQGDRRQRHGHSYRRRT